MQERRDERKGGKQERRDSRDEGCKFGSEMALIKKEDSLKGTVFCHGTLQFPFVSLVKCFVSRSTKHSKLAFVC